MITSPIPTRAEVSDVANAVLDGTDAVMLSAETAAGQFPLETVQAVHRVVMEAEKEYINQYHAQITDQVFLKTDETIAAAAIYTAKHLKVKAIAALTQSGNAAQWLSRADAEVPIYALSPDKYARRKLTLHRGVYPFPIEQANKNKDEILREMEQVLLQQKMVSLGDVVLLTFGEPIGSPGGTNTLKIVKIGENKQA
jgi:pyruvate kinase